MMCVQSCTDSGRSAAATLSAAWWIQRALRRQAELDRIPIEAIATATNRINELVNQCLDASHDATPTEGALLHKLRLLSNEITWLGTLAAQVDATEVSMEPLHDAYRVFKNALTLGASIELPAAGRGAVRLRATCTETRRAVCKRILES
jgi:hypothetical protein